MNDELKRLAEILTVPGTVDPSVDHSLTPQLLHTDSGAARRVGVEIEFGGLDIMTSAELVKTTFGGNIVTQTEYEIQVKNSTLGDFKIEVDLTWLKRMGQERLTADAEPGIVEQMSERIVAEFARQWVPCEIISDPLPLTQLTCLDRLISVLRQAGALGTDDSLGYAFGVHFNPEAPSTDSAGILAYLQAFVLLYDWFLQTMTVDLTRRITPFVDFFPKTYVRYILAENYQPDITALIADYLDYNPTRNRALDLLPLFAHLTPDTIAQRIEDPVNARPTYHYRLANSRISDPNWSISAEWCYWLMVEALAQDHGLRQRLATDYLNQQELPLGGVFSDWADAMDRWLLAR